MVVDLKYYGTSRPYRVVTAEDLQPGVEMVAVDLNPFNGRQPYQGAKRVFDWDDPTRVNTVIRIDSIETVAAHEEEDDRGNVYTIPARDYVYYHCIQPAWDGQCFVPKESFLSSEDPDGVFLIAEAVSVSA